MATCPKCFTRYPDEMTTCEVEGESLVPDAAVAMLDKDVPAGSMVGEYKIESKIGEGGFGAVYKAVQPLIGKHVAIKILSRKLSSDPEMVSRFVAEARAVNQIRSKHIVDIFGFGSLPDGRQYYVMELLRGATLEDYVKQRGSLPVGEAIPLLRGIARALDAAHAGGIVHRDLKPENVFLVQDEEGGLVPKLLDFGIAKLLGSATSAHKTRTGVPMGTPYYMSPEQCQGQPVDHLTDVYSLGILVFQVLTGELPFQGDSFIQVMYQHVGGQRPLASEKKPGLPAALDAPIDAMLAKVPAERPKSAGEAIEQLVHTAQKAGVTIGTLPVGTPISVTGDDGRAFVNARTEVGGASSTLSAAETLPRAPSRSRTALFVVAGVVGVSVVAGVFALLLRGPADASKPETPAGATTAPVAVSTTPPAVVPPSASIAKPPEQPATVKIKLESAPANVQVFLGDKSLGVSAGVVELPRGDAKVELTAKAEGFNPKKLELTPSSDQTLKVKLVPKATQKQPVEF